MHSNTSTFTLKCTSTNSPATTVILTKDGSITEDYSLYQILKDRSLATYDSYFSINAAIDELAGTYSCSVINSAGSSNVGVVTVQGMALYCNIV